MKKKKAEIAKQLLGQDEMQDYKQVAIQNLSREAKKAAAAAMIRLSQSLGATPRYIMGEEFTKGSRDFWKNSSQGILRSDHQHHCSKNSLSAEKNAQQSSNKIMHPIRVQTIKDLLGNDSTGGSRDDSPVMRNKESSRSPVQTSAQPGHLNWKEARRSNSPQYSRDAAMTRPDALVEPPEDYSDVFENLLNKEDGVNSDRDNLLATFEAENQMNQVAERKVRRGIENIKINKLPLDYKNQGGRTRKSSQSSSQDGEQEQVALIHDIRRQGNSPAQARNLQRQINYVKKLENDHQNFNYKQTQPQIKVSKQFSKQMQSKFRRREFEQQEQRLHYKVMDEMNDIEMRNLQNIE